MDTPDEWTALFQMSAKADKVVTATRKHPIVICSVLGFIGLLISTCVPQNMWDEHLFCSFCRQSWFSSSSLQYLYFVYYKH
ncbi:hypothetical protein J6590_040413 [Homalodisca vitripennis]|nr:hypothetical protein J6590_040413 [Homalodisca vitripennis]